MMTTDALVELCHGVGFAVTVTHPRVVIAEQGLMGSSVRRGVVFTKNIVTWLGALYLLRDIQWEAEPLALSGPLMDIAAARLWFGGIVSIPMTDVMWPSSLP